MRVATVADGERSRTLDACVALDTDEPYHRTALVAGTVLARPFAPGSWVERGDTLLLVASEELRGAQELYLWYRTGGRVDPGVAKLSTWRARQLARARLVGLRFPESQIRAIVRRRRILDPVPILAPASGRLFTVAEAGAAFVPDDTLYGLVHRRIVRCTVGAAERERFSPGQPVIVWIRGDDTGSSGQKPSAAGQPKDGAAPAGEGSESKPISADLPERRINAIVRAVAAPAPVILDLLEPGMVLAPGTRVRVELPLPGPVQAVSASARSDWPYALPPRGAAARAMRLIGQESNASSAQPPAQADPAPGQALPIGPGARPSREPASYEPPGPARVPEARAHRFTLPLTPTAWCRLAISTVTVVPRRFYPVWHCTGVIEAMPAPQQAVLVGTPVAGLYTPPDAALMPGDHLAAGSEIGTVALAPDLRELQAAYLSVRETDPAAASALRAALQAAGLPRAAVAQLDRNLVPIDTLPVFTVIAGRVETLAIEPRAVPPGAHLLTLTPTNGWLVRCTAASDFPDHLPARVGVRVRRIGGSAGPVLFAERDVPVIEMTACGAMTRFGLPLPQFREAALEPGHAVSVTLTAEAEAREGLSVPRDAVAAVLRGREVLVHSGPGGLTPVSVVTGFEDEGGVALEVLYGLRAGDRVVRDLAHLRDADDGVRAILEGFWNPAAAASPTAAVRTLARVTNPLLVGGRPRAD